MPDEKPGKIKIIDSKEYLGAVKDLVLSGRTVSLTVTGGSMTPFLAGGRDRVFLSPVTAPLRKGNVVMYTRPNGQYILHRIVRVRECSVFDIAGDAQTEIECGVRREQIFAKVTSIERKGKRISPPSFFWFFFAHIWIRLIPARKKIIRLETALHIKL